MEDEMIDASRSGSVAASADRRVPNRSLPVPAAFSTIIVLKIGEPFGTSRSSYGAPLSLQLDVDDGYLGFWARVQRKVDQLKEVEWPQDSPILLKPTAGASQATFVALAESDEELAVQLASVWRLAAKRKSGQASFKLELFTYVHKVAASGTIRRATKGRIAAAATLIDDHLSSLPDAEQLGEASRAYWTVTHARPENTPLAVPTNPTFTQLRRIDEFQREIDSLTQQQAAMSEFVRIRCRLNGGMVPLELNLSDLRDALGLPPYDLRPPCRPPVASNLQPQTLKTRIT